MPLEQNPLTPTQTAGQALVAQLEAYGVEHVFCIPGESFLPVLDALVDSSIEVTVCRHESGAAMMAEAVGRFTGRPGVAFVTRSPGATNASVAVSIAQADSTPMILFIGQVPRSLRGRDAWQEMNHADVFAPLTKWAAEPWEADRLTEFVGRGFHISMAGRQGPVVLSLPRDVIAETIPVKAPPPFKPVVSPPSSADVDEFLLRLAAAKKPLAILGGSGWSASSRDAFTAFSERYQLAVATSYRRLPLFDPLHPSYIGDLGLGANPALIRRVGEADLILLLGGRLGEVPSQGYTLLEVGARDGRLVHVFPDPTEFGRLYGPSLSICATASAFAEALGALPSPNSALHWQSWTRDGHTDYLAYSESTVPQPGPVNISEIMVWLRENLSPDTVVCNGAGGYAAWLHRFFRFRQFASHMAPTSATMGYGLPAAIAIKRIAPSRPVVVVAGDGDFLMTGQEFATALQYGLSIIVIVLDNGSYGSIRMAQELNYPTRVIATDLINPDFAAYARAFGGFGVTVERTQEFASAFFAAQNSGLASIIHVKYDKDGLTPTQTISAIRAKAGGK